MKTSRKSKSFLEYLSANGAPAELQSILSGARVFHLDQSFVNSLAVLPGTERVLRAADTFEGGQRAYDPGEHEDPVDLPFKTVIFDSDTGLTPGGPWAAESYAIAIHETAPRDYQIWVWAASNDNEGVTALGSCHRDDVTYPIMTVMVQHICSGLRGKNISVARETGLRKIKIESDVKKTFYRPSHVTRVFAGKHTSFFPKPVYGTRIEWDFSFEVRGHWRHIPGIGKDRDGIYGVRGATWVIPHVRGNKDLDPSHQLRLVKPSREGLVDDPPYERIAPTNFRSAGGVC